jgi:hypothetical protein
VVPNQKKREKNVEALAERREEAAVSLGLVHCNPPFPDFATGTMSCPLESTPY